MRRLLRVVLAVAAAAIGVVAIFSQRSGIASALAELHPAYLVLSELAVVGAAVCMLLAWRTLLTDLGSPLSFRVAARVLFLSQLGKYLPGSVWPLLAQIELGREHKVAARRSATAGMITLVLSLVTGLFWAAVTLPLLSPGAASRYGWAFLVAPVLLVAIHPRVLNPVLARGFGLLRRQPPEPISLAGVGRCVGWSTLGWLCYGLHIWFLVYDLGATGWRSLPLSAGAFAFAWSLGFLVIFAPSGAGVREAALVLALSPVLATGPALLVALASRVLTGVTDLLLAAVAAAASRRRRGALPVTGDPAQPAELAEPATGRAEPAEPATRLAEPAGPAEPVGRTKPAASAAGQAEPVGRMKPAASATGQAEPAGRTEPAADRAGRAGATGPAGQQAAAGLPEPAADRPSV